jgi:tRNA(Ile)-lysidine synthase
VDEDKIAFPLILRKWREGDYFYPSGMTGKKKLSKYFKDEKYSMLDKENQWLLCTDDQIIWVIGKRADQRFLAQKLTVKTIQIVLK